MSDETAINVNFSKAMPLFPLDAAVLLPQQVIPLHIFEPRYRQMVKQVLDSSGQFAMASFLGDRWKQEYHGRPPLRPAVCVAQIVKHELAADGTYTLLVQGVCRARIVTESTPEEGRLFREAKLEPVGLEIDADEDELSEVRDLLEELLEEGPLTRMAAADPVLKFVRDEQIPVPALLELVSFSLIARPDLMYGLLAEEDVRVRARLVLGELSHLESLIKKAASQKRDDVPKGVSLN